MSDTHRIYINRAHVFDEGVTWTTAAGMYPHAYVPEEAYLTALARVTELESVLQGIVDLGGTMGSAFYAETVDRAARRALQSGGRDNG